MHKVGYAFVPEELLNDQRKKARHVAVWAAVDSFCTKDRRECWASQNLIIQRSGCSSRTFRDALKDLENWGYIAVDRYRNGNLKSRNRYRMLRSANIADRQPQEATVQEANAADRSGKYRQSMRQMLPIDAANAAVSTKKAPKEGPKGSRKKAKARTLATHPPTIEQCADAFRASSRCPDEIADSEAVHFHGYHSQYGWSTKRGALKDLAGCVSTWISKDFDERIANAKTDDDDYDIFANAPAHLRRIQ